MSRSLLQNRMSHAGGRSARHGLLPTVSGHAAGVAAAPPAAATPSSVSAANCPPSGPVAPSPAAFPVVAALTIFEGQAVFRILPPGSSGLLARDIFRFRRGSREETRRQS